MGSKEVQIMGIRVLTLRPGTLSKITGMDMMNPSTIMLQYTPHMEVKTQGQLTLKLLLLFPNLVMHNNMGPVSQSNSMVQACHPSRYTNIQQVGPCSRRILHMPPHLPQMEVSLALSIHSKYKLLLPMVNLLLLGRMDHTPSSQPQPILDMDIKHHKMLVMAGVQVLLMLLLLAVRLSRATFNSQPPNRAMINQLHSRAVMVVFL